MAESSRLVENERVKLTATYLNGLATSLTAAGVIAPLISALTSADAAPGWELALIFFSCLLVSGGLHSFARYLLRGLTE